MYITLHQHAITTELAAMKNSAIKLYYNRNSQYGSRIRQTGYLPLPRCIHVPSPSQSSPSGTHSLWRRSKISNPEAPSYDKA